MKLINKIIKFIQDPERDIDERVFFLLVMVAEAALIFVLFGDIVVRENPIEIITLGLAVILNLVVAHFCILKHRVDIGAKINSIVTVFVIMPIVFFFGGGPDGGAIIWFTFSAIYTGLLLKGRMRSAMMTILFATEIIDYSLAWFYPWLVKPHGKQVYYIDSLISVLAVGFFAYVMVRFMNEVYISENERTKAESQKAEQLNKAQNSFFANMSHEIRTPINTILGLNEMILREDISDEVAEDAENIQSAGKLLLTLINDILDKSKLESGQMELAEAEYNFKELLSDVVTMFEPKAKDKNLVFEVDIDKDFPSGLIGDEVRIKQILINVINNAFKYTNEGKVIFSADYEKKSDDKIIASFTVSDTGMGIKRENIPILFSAFKRVEGEKVRHIEGTGLGLSIVKSLLDIMGGTITVDSVYTKGSTFVIEIPQKVSDFEGVGDAAAFAAGYQRNRIKYVSEFEAPEARILAVDDNKTNLMVVQKLLRDTRVMLDLAESGAKALEMTMKTKYHIILMDHLMPEMDGIECAKEIKNQKGGLCKNSKIVALTANAGVDNKNLFDMAGFDGYITKPVSGNALELEILRLLPRELLSATKEREDILESAVEWMNAREKKRSIVITTESISDLPDDIIAKYGIKILPHKVRTSRGLFRDGQEIDAKGLLKYISENSEMVKPSAPDVSEHERFFAEALLNADTVLHIALSGAVVGNSIDKAREAAKSFGNVYVFDSRNVSSGQGFLVIEACKMAEKGMPAEEIISELRKINDKIHTSFVATGLTYLARLGHIPLKLAYLFDSLAIKPVISIKNGRLVISKLHIGSIEHSREAYIRDEVFKMKRANKEVLFITHSGLDVDELMYLKTLVEKKVKFENIFIVQASPAISMNCGPGAFGLIYKDI